MSEKAQIGSHWKHKQLGQKVKVSGSEAGRYILTNERGAQFAALHEVFLQHYEKDDDNDDIGAGYPDRQS